MSQPAAPSSTGEAGLRFDPFTGAPIIPVNPVHRFDPFTGEPIKVQRFDPFTGQPILAAPQLRFDPFTGRPVEASVVPVQSFDPFTGCPEAAPQAAEIQAPAGFNPFGGLTTFTLNKFPAAAAVPRYPPGLGESTENINFSRYSVGSTSGQSTLDEFGVTGLKSETSLRSPDGDSSTAATTHDNSKRYLARPPGL